MFAALAAVATAMAPTVATVTLDHQRDDHTDDEHCDHDPNPAGDDEGIAGFFHGDSGKL